MLSKDPYGEYLCGVGRLELFNFLVINVFKRLRVSRLVGNYP